MRVSTTVPELRSAVTAAAPELVTDHLEGALIFSATDGDEGRVGRPFFTLFGPEARRLVVTTDRDEFVERSLHHLSLPIWLEERPELWWTGLRALVGPDGAVLISRRRLGEQPGLLRSVQRAGFEVVDSLLTALDPETGEVLILPSRLDPEHGILDADAAGQVRRLPVSTLAFPMVEYSTMLEASPEFFAKALATAVEPTAAVDRQQLLETAAALAGTARRVVLGDGRPADVVRWLRGDD